MPFYIYGYSLGGLIAQRIAHSLPLDGLIHFAPAFAFNPPFTETQLEELDFLMSSNQPHKTFKPPAKDRDTELFLYYGFVKDPEQSVYFKW